LRSMHAEPSAANTPDVDRRSGDPVV
jgi:hypothetical protein